MKQTEVINQRLSAAIKRRLDIACRIDGRTQKQAILLGIQWYCKSIDCVYNIDTDRMAREELSEMHPNEVKQHTGPESPPVQHDPKPEQPTNPKLSDILNRYKGGYENI
jgi:hypothetical protein